MLRSIEDRGENDRITVLANPHPEHNRSPWPWPMTLTFNPRLWPTHTNNYQGRTDRRTRPVALSSPLTRSIGNKNSHTLRQTSLYRNEIGTVYFFARRLRYRHWLAWIVQYPELVSWTEIHWRKFDRRVIEWPNPGITCLLSRFRGSEMPADGAVLDI